MTQFYKFATGDKVRDIVTMLEGTVMCCVVWYNGCIRYALQAPMDKDKKVPELAWVDEPQLAIVESDPLAYSREVKATGGPQRDPSGPR